MNQPRKTKSLHDPSPTPQSCPPLQELETLNRNSELCVSDKQFQFGRHRNKNRGFVQLMKRKLELAIGPEYGDLLDRLQAERLITKKKPALNRPTRRSLPDEAAF
jgi:hypothetical protein